MSACPSCGAEISGGSCKRCGAKAGPALDIPDLDLSPMSAPAPKPQPAPRRVSGQMSAVSDDVLADDPGEASFELAIEEGDRSLPPYILAAPPSSTPNLSGPPSGKSGGHPAAPISAGSLSRENSRPDVRISAPPLEEEKPRIDPVEAKQFAEFGAPPTKLLETPLYAFKVKMRQSELRRGLWRAKLAFERAQKERSAAEADTSRLEEVKLRLTGEVAAKEHEVDLHEAALLSYDAPALKRGMGIFSAVAGALFLLIFLPIFFRMCIGVEAPPLNP